jgi:hypothetical protein
MTKFRVWYHNGDHDYRYALVEAKDAEAARAQVVAAGWRVQKVKVARGPVRCEAL